MKIGKRGMLALICLVAAVLFLGAHMPLLIASETLQIAFDAENPEYDVEELKYRITLTTDCRELKALRIRCSGPLAPEAVGVECVHFDGSRDSVRGLTFTADGDWLTARSDLTLEKMADGAVRFDICLDKDSGAALTEVEADVVSREFLPLLVLALLIAGGFVSVFNALPPGCGRVLNGACAAVILLGTAALDALLPELAGNTEYASLPVGDYLLNLLFCLVLIGILALVLNSVRNGALLMHAALSVLAIVNAYVTAFRGQPIQPADIFTTLTAVRVAGRYSYEVTLPLLLTGCFALLWGAYLLVVPLLSVSVRSRRRSAALRLIGLLILLLAIPGLYREPLLSLLPEPSYWNSREIYEKHGFLRSFISYGRNLRRIKVPGYDASETESVREAYTASGAVAEEGTASGDQPDIIVIMNEAFSDFRKMAPLAVNQPYMPFFDQLSDESVTGTLVVPTFAGGTANTEYEFLTGNSMSFFRGSGVPYTMMPRNLRESVARVLSKRGYETVAMHPNAAENYNRHIIYPAMGFDSYLTTADLFAESERLRGMVSDRGDYEALLGWIDQREDTRPYFIFNITMQNHSDFTSRTIPAEIFVEGREDPDVTSYLSLIRESDRAFAYLIGELRQREKETIVLMFGDHYPAVNSDFYRYLEEENTRTDPVMKSLVRYEIPFLIWSNRGIGQESGLYISANYLSNLLFEKAGLALSPYQRFLLTLMKDYPVITSDSYLASDGTGRFWEAEEPLPDAIRQYLSLQYDQLYLGGEEAFYES